MQCTLLSSVGGGNLLVNILKLALVHTRWRVLGGFAAHVAMCLNVLGDVDANRVHRPHGDGSNGRDGAFGPMHTMRIAKATRLLEGLRLPEGNADTDGVERDALAMKTSKR
jgi:hypothetical protein